MKTKFVQIVQDAWNQYDDTREIVSITDISAKVSTNHVYKLLFTDRTSVVAKLSYFGEYQNFVEDHSIISTLANNLPAPFENFLSTSLMKGNQVYVYRSQQTDLDAWVVFYRPIKSREKMPRRLNEDRIRQFAAEFATFHKACFQIRNTLPKSSKTAETDIVELLNLLETDKAQHQFHSYIPLIKKHAMLFLQNSDKLVFDSMPRIPVFVDWNIGNFSVTPNGRFYSRWDYDWFRISSRVMDFYFASRVVSNRGDKTVFSYDVDVLMEDRFILFLQRYHDIYPLSKNEILLLKETYRFFILNYVIKYGNYFFNESFADKLQSEAFNDYLLKIDNFNPKKLLEALNL